MSSKNNLLADWLESRLGLSLLQGVIGKKKVPQHSQSFWYYIGGIAMVLLLIQFVTGALLMVYYIPEINSAYSSVLFINSQIEFGWFFRSMHSWGANILILVLLLHMMSTFFMKAYRGPRELTWLTGLGLLVLSMGFGFTGYLLPWDKIAFFATKIGIDITAQIPIIGSAMAEILRGGEGFGQATLSRFFVIHVIFLPAALILLLGVHLLLVQVHGMSEPEEFLKASNKKYELFFPDFFLKDLMIWLLVLNLLAVFTSFMPWGLGEQADPFAPAPVGIKPEWYFLAMFQFLKILPPHIGFLEGEQLGLLIFLLIALVFAVAPFIDKKDNSLVSSLLNIFGIFIMIAFVFFTIWGAIA